MLTLLVIAVCLDKRRCLLRWICWWRKEEEEEEEEEKKVELAIERGGIATVDGMI